MTEEQEKQESQKTLVAFVAGLLIGGLLVWVFGGTPENVVSTEGADESQTETSESLQDNTDDADAETSDADGADEESATQTMQTGEGEVEVADQAAGLVVALDSATFPVSEGWIGVRSFPNGQLGSILGVARFSEDQGLIPTEVELLVPTTVGRTYAVTFFSENGDMSFDPAYDVQIETNISTFVAK